MIGSFELPGIALFILAGGIAITGSLVVVFFLLLHFITRAKGESWPASTRSFRALLSAGTVVIFNLLLFVACLFLLQETTVDLRRWLDSVAPYVLLTASVIIAFLVYLSLRMIIPRLLSTGIGRSLVIAWATVSAVLAILISVPVVGLFIYNLFLP